MIIVYGYPTEDARNNRLGEPKEIGIAHSPDQLLDLRRNSVPHTHRFLDLVNEHGQSMFYPEAVRHLEAEVKQQETARRLQRLQPVS